MPKDLAPYIAPIIVLALIVWRGARAKPSPVRLTRMWIRPVILAAATVATLALTAKPNAAVIAAFVAAGLAGAGVGHLFGRHLELSIDPATGAISSKATPIGTFLVIGLFLIRYGLKLVFPQLAAQPAARPSADIMVWTDGALVFGCALILAQVLTIWLRTRPLIANHAAGTGKT
ncbi:MAG: DUF1453 family protein [Proteobacteria bacterium]|nr:DUF1453 family protein [Pseudomonadota bacterium]